MKDFETIYVEPEVLIYPVGLKPIDQELEQVFFGINTKQHLIPENTLEEIQKIQPILDKELKEIEKALVSNYKLKRKSNKKILVIRKFFKYPKYKGVHSSEDNSSVIFISPEPIEKDKKEYGVYGYKSVLVTEIKED